MPTAAERSTVDEAEAEYLWRHARFRELGCDLRQATALAGSKADWHEAERLVAEGCPVRLLVRLLL